MAKTLNVDVDPKLKEKTEEFVKRTSSNMYFQSELTSNSLTFDWLNEIEFACPYIDNIIRNPKMALINEEDVVKIEKAKKITVASVKDLSRHTHFIEKIDPITQEVKPSKILIQRNEETFSTYENRFIYTLIDNMIRFLLRKSSTIEDFETKNSKFLEYASSTVAGNDKISIELKISSSELPKGKSGDDFESEIDKARARLKRIKDYTSSWKRSEFIRSLEKAHVAFLIPPIRKTNMILKNPNFQIATKLWTFLQTYENNDEENDGKNNLDTAGDNILKSILDDAFLMDYFVLDSISSSKKEQKEKLAKYAVIMISQQLQRMIALLLNSGIELSDEDILSMLSCEIKNEKNRRLVGSNDVKKKFKSAMDEYLERTQEYL